MSLNAWRVCRAFTLVELLIVIAIVITLAGLLFPALSSAKKRSKMALAESNLHHCYLALAIYQEADGTWEDLPDRHTACKVSGAASARDSADYGWPNSCANLTLPSMVGSVVSVTTILRTDCLRE